MRNNRDRPPGAAVNPPEGGSWRVIGAIVSPGMGAMALNIPGKRGRILILFFQLGWAPDFDNTIDWKLYDKRGGKRICRHRPRGNILPPNET